MPFLFAKASGCVSVRTCVCVGGGGGGGGVGDQCQTMHCQTIVVLVKHTRKTWEGLLVSHQVPLPENCG